MSPAREYGSISRLFGQAIGSIPEVAAALLTSDRSFQLCFAAGEGSATWHFNPTRRSQSSRVVWSVGAEPWGPSSSYLEQSCAGVAPLLGQLLGNRYFTFLQSCRRPSPDMHLEHSAFFSLEHGMSTLQNENSSEFS